MNDLFNKRMRFVATTEQDRAIKNKQMTLQDSINRSYFGFDVTKPEISDNIKYRVLITRDDEDEQIISSFFEDNIKVGSIIHWLRTDTYWLVHEQNVNEIAYFEGKMIECKNFQITVDGEKFSTWGRIVFNSKTGEEMFFLYVIYVYGTVDSKCPSISFVNLLSSNSGKYVSPSNSASISVIYMASTISIT